MSVLVVGVWVELDDMSKLAVCASVFDGFDDNGATHGLVANAHCGLYHTITYVEDVSKLAVWAERTRTLEPISSVRDPAASKCEGGSLSIGICCVTVELEKLRHRVRLVVECGGEGQASVDRKSSVYVSPATVT